MARLDFESTLDRLMRMIKAGYPIIYLVSHEEARVFDCVARIVNRLRAEEVTGDGDRQLKRKSLLRWAQGLGLQSVRLNDQIASVSGDWLDAEGLPAMPALDLKGDTDAAGAINQLRLSQGQKYSELANSVTVFFDLHPYLAQYEFGPPGEMVRPLRNLAELMRKHYDLGRGQTPHRYQTVIIVAPTSASLSRELERDIAVLDFPLPEVPELKSVLSDMLKRGLLNFPEPIPPEDLRAFAGVDTTDAYRERVVDLVSAAGRGLTLHTYQQGLNMIQVEQKTIKPKHVDYMLQLKANTISDPALQYTPRVEIDLGGLDGVKKWTRTRSGPAVSSDVRTKFRLPAPKGVMLCGASGGGKSQLAKLIAKEFNLALLRLDVGALFGSYVGESEQRTRRALQLAEVLAPVVLWIDEIDKAFSGAAGGSGDNGVSARVLGHFLTWLSEKQDDVFVVVTANKFEKILEDFPEFGRKGRFDEIFWVGLPRDEARRAIFQIYLDRHLKDQYLQTGDSQRMYSDLVAVSERMTGAEIESAVNEALYAAYDKRERDDGIGGRFNSDLLVQVVEANQRRALYQAADGQLTKQEKTASEKGWLDAETGKVVIAPGDGGGQQ